MTSPARPRPILDVIRNGGVIISVGGSIIAAAVTLGLLTAGQANAVTAILGALATLLPAATAITAQAHVLRVAEPQVTPVADPRSVNGAPLVAASPPTP